MTSDFFHSNNPIVVIGSGLAGLLAARTIAEKQPVVILTKRKLCDSNTQHSQGGIAAVWSAKDSSTLHVKDTLFAGRGLCDEKAVTFMSEHSRNAIEVLVNLGVLFDKDREGHYRLGLEGAHSTPRILYAGGDATGAEIQRALAESVANHPNITILENSHVVNIKNQNGQVAGVEYYNEANENVVLDCEQVVLATGGGGRIYQYTSNPDTATGEGNVLAYLAGAELADLEFYQFHPTGLNVPGADNFLISEAVRGEGAILRNSSGEAIMANVHTLKDLAPRDIVARTIAAEMFKTGKNVYLDATGIDSQKLCRRFPTIFESCLQHHIDIRKDQIPITPVAHYMIGGVVTDLYGRTSVKGLYASGEVARTGVHGANRLASNSLLECAVFSIKIAQSISMDQSHPPELWKSPGETPEVNSDRDDTISVQPDIEQLRSMMWQNVGLIRNRTNLLAVATALHKTPSVFQGRFTPAAFELFSLRNLAKLITLSALQREESRGSHFRSDFPESNDESLYSIKRSLTRDKDYFNHEALFN